MFHAYSHNPRPRRMNPVGAGAALGLLAGGALVGLGTFAFVRVAEQRSPQSAAIPPAPEPGEHELSGVYVPGATLAGSPTVSSGFRLPVVITTYSLTEGDGADAPTLDRYPTLTRAEQLVIRSKDGELIPLEYIGAAPDGDFEVKVDELALLQAGIGYDVSSSVQYGGTPAGAREQILKLVTDLSGPVADSAFDRASALVAEGHSFSEPSTTRDLYVQGVLKEVAPEIAWPASPETLKLGAPRWRVWMGVDLVGQVAYQSASMAHPLLI